MFCDHRQRAGVTKRRDKMCFRSTAGTPEIFGQAPPDTRVLATLLLPFCYPFATKNAFRAAGCYPFATPLLPVCYSFAIELPPLPFCAPSPRHVSDVYIAAPQGCPF